MADTVSSDSVAQDQLRAFVERIERLEEEIKALNGDKSEVYAEAKGNGFDVKVLRKIIADRRKDYSARMEFETIYDLYAAALGMQPASRVHAREGDYDAETGEIFDTKSEPLPPQTTAAQEDAGAGAAGGDSSSGRTERSADGQTNSPAVGNTRQQAVPVQPYEAVVSAPVESASGEISTFGAGDDNPGAAISTAAAETAKTAGERGGSPAASARMKTADEVADGMGLPPEPHPGCRNPKLCKRFSHMGLCAPCRGEERLVA